MQTNKYFYPSLVVLALALSLSALIAAFSYQKNANLAPSSRAMISVSGEGKVYVKPDIATLTFTMREVGKTVSESQAKVEDKTKTLLAELEKLGVEEKDITTAQYSVMPKYTYNQIYCITYPCPQGKQVLEGYEVAQTISVKIRDLDKAGEALSIVGKANITEVTGPDFSVEKYDEELAKAKKEAIEKAQEKAKETARALGVRLSTMVSYSDGGHYYPPYMSARVEGYGMGGAADQKSVSLPQGETTITATVTLTYEVE